MLGLVRKDLHEDLRSKGRVDRHQLVEEGGSSIPGREVGVHKSQAMGKNLIY